MSRTIGTTSLNTTPRGFTALDNGVDVVHTPNKPIFTPPISKRCVDGKSSTNAPTRSPFSSNPLLSSVETMFELSTVALSSDKRWPRIIVEWSNSWLPRHACVTGTEFITLTAAAPRSYELNNDGDKKSPLSVQINGSLPSFVLSRINFERRPKFSSSYTSLTLKIFTTRAFDRASGQFASQESPLAVLAYTRTYPPLRTPGVDARRTARLTPARAGATFKIRPLVVHPSLGAHALAHPAPGAERAHTIILTHRARTRTNPRRRRRARAQRSPWRYPPPNDSRAHSRAHTARAAHAFASRARACAARTRSYLSLACLRRCVRPSARKGRLRVAQSLGGG
mmetsp:Transcript_6872/g.22622  ORF Transcript_6872/g.22622 Transcript_6872/m.22622 type:complete len:339 (-) Transcript_6872:3-1019(-)